MRYSRVLEKVKSMHKDLDPVWDKAVIRKAKRLHAEGLRPERYPGICLSEQSLVGGEIYHNGIPEGLK